MLPGMLSWESSNGKMHPVEKTEINWWWMSGAVEGVQMVCKPWSWPYVVWRDSIPFAWIRELVSRSEPGIWQNLSDNYSKWLLDCKGLKRENAPSFVNHRKAANEGTSLLQALNVTTPAPPPTLSALIFLYALQPKSLYHCLVLPQLWP